MSGPLFPPLRSPEVTPTVGEMLDFEAAHPGHSGWKGEDIRRDLGIEPARYYMLLGRAVDSDEGRQHAPILAREISSRLARHRAARLGGPAPITPKDPS
jgi:hypothetical protein